MKNLKQFIGNVNEDFYKNTNSGYEARKNEIEARLAKLNIRDYIINDDFTVQLTNKMHTLISSESEMELGFVITSIPTASKLAIEMPRLKSLEEIQVPSVYKISLSYCKYLKDLNGLPECRDLNLYACNSLKDLKGCQGVLNLSISACDNLTSLTGLSKGCKKVEITGCPKFKETGKISFSDINQLTYYKE